MKSVRRIFQTFILLSYPFSMFGQYQTKWLQNDFFNSVTLSIVDILKNGGGYCCYHPLIEEDTAKQFPLKNQSLLNNNRLDSLLSITMFMVPKKTEAYKYKIFVTKIDTVEYRLDFTLTFSKTMFDKSDTGYSLYMNYNNYELFIAFKDSLDINFLSTLPSSKFIHPTFMHQNGFERTNGCYDGSSFYYFYSLDKDRAKLEKYYDYNLLPKKLKKKTIEYLRRRQFE